MSAFSPPSRCSPKGGRHEVMCCKDAGLQRGVDLEGVPRRLGKEISASENVGPRRGVDCDVPHWLGRKQNTIYKGVETFPLQTT